MRVLVTGANGFIGTHLCRRLAAQGIIVRACVRTYQDNSLTPRPSEQYVIGDIRKFSDWPNALREVDAVVHLCARAHVLKDVAADPLTAYRQVNVHPTERLFQACAQGNVRRAVFLSTIGVLGRGGSVPYQEHDPFRPEDRYAWSKVEAEQIVTRIGEDKQLETVILRPPLVYGPNVGGNFLRIMKLVQRGIPMPLGQVQAARSMIYVENLVDAICTALEHPLAPGQVFHVADAETITSRDLARHLALTFEKQPRLVPVPVPLLRWAGKLSGRGLDVDRLTRPLVISTEKITRQLGWQPCIPSQEGIRRTAVAFKQSTLLDQLVHQAA